MGRLVLVVLAGGVVLVSGAQAVTVNRSLHIATVPKGFELVRLSHRFGTLRIEGHVQDSLMIDAWVRVSGRDRQLVESFAEGIDIQLSDQGESLVVVTSYPRLQPQDTLFSYDVDLGVRVPAGLRVSAQNAFGDIRLRDLPAGAKLTSRYGNIELERVSGGEVLGRFGDVSVAGNRGPLVIDNGFGNVFLRQVNGAVRVQNSYGSVEAERPQGTVAICNSFGNVVARPGPGRMAIVNRCGEVSAWVTDPTLTLLDIVAQHSKVRLNLGPGVPFQIEGRTRGGRIEAGLPLATAETLGAAVVTGGVGEGGPAIAVQAEMGDIYIGVESLVPGGAPERR